ncbi:WbqC family protein [Aliarcobacter butzleri]|nr:WbqC family protein [Aliarcobacter butzleri]
MIKINSEIKTKLRWSSEFELLDRKSEKLLGICKDCNADIYLSGPSTKYYFNQELAKQENIKVEWMDYSGYKEYEQLNPPFEHGVTILDLIFNQGYKAKEFMKSFK